MKQGTLEGHEEDEDEEEGRKAEEEEEGKAEEGEEGKRFFPWPFTKEAKHGKLRSFANRPNAFNSNAEQKVKEK